MEPIIFTGDWQLDVANIANVEATVDDIIAHARAHGVRHVVHTGDVKDALSPIDGRVINAMVRFAQKMYAAKLHVHCLMGNHDYYSTTRGAESWMAFLSSIGWACADAPVNVNIGGWEMFLFPYAFDVEGLKAALASTGPHPKKLNNIQVFHQGLMGAKLSELRRADSEPLTVADLHPERYMWSIGGHYHAQHCVDGNVWYCGSPFCTRWDEANQTKGFLLLDARGALVPLASSIPGWYDPSWPGFPERVPAGARVRVPVALEKGVEPSAAIAHATGRAEALYTGAQIVVNPTVVDRSTTVTDIKGDATDDDLVDAYVEATFEQEHPDVQFALRGCLYAAVAEVASHRRADLQVTFDAFEGENFLSFEKLTINYHAKGLWVVYGVNDDRPGRSNGSGKTSYIQAPLAVLWGRTLKEQKHDGLKRRDTPRGARSYGRLSMTLADGRALVVERSRQPVHVKLWLDGEDISTGKADAQITRDIEKLTGLTAEVMQAALYVDQREVNKLLTGQPAERKAVLAAFLNTERYTKAQEAVKRSVDALSREIGKWDTYRATVEANVQSYTEMLEKLRVRRSEEAELLERRAESIKAEGIALGEQKQAVNLKHAAVLVEVQTLNRAVEVAMEAYQQARGDTSGYAARLITLERNLADARKKQPDKCFTCGAPLKPKDMTKVIQSLEEAITPLKEQRDQARQAEETKLAEWEKAKAAAKPKADALAALVSEGNTLTYAIQEKRRDYLGAKQAADAAKETEHGDETEYQRKLRRCQAYLRNFPHFRAELDADMAVLQMALRALGRDGIPAMVASLLCPRLNASAAHYSHLLGDGTIGVAFTMDADGLAVEVVNPTGGESVKDQSTGELRIAALITTLALRDNVRSNVLFLDEMSLGLDSLSARELARGVTQLKERFPAIFITSHDPYVLNGLEDYGTIEIRKKDGISKVTTGVHTVDRGAPQAQEAIQSAGGGGRASNAGSGAGKGTQEGQRTRRQQ